MRLIHSASVVALAVAACSVAGLARADSRLFTVRTTQPSITVTEASRNGTELPVAGFNDNATVFRIENPDGPIPCANRLEFVTSDGQHIDASVNLCSSNWDLTVSVSPPGTTPQSPPGDTAGPTVVQPSPAPPPGVTPEQPPAETAEPTVVQPAPEATPEPEPPPEAAPPAPAPEPGPPMQWTFAAQNDNATLAYSAADGSATAFEAACSPGSASGEVHLAASPGLVAAGAATGVRFQAGAFSRAYTATGTAVAGDDAVHPTLVITLADPFWSVLIRESALSVAVGDQPAYVLSLSGSAVRVRQFLAACNASAAAAPRPGTLPSPPAPIPALPGNGVAYSCKDGSALQISFDESSAAVSEYGRRPVVLFATPAAIGERYEHGAAVLQVQGDQVVWSDGYGNSRYCLRQ